MTTLPPFPLSDEVLDQVEHALKGCLNFEDGGDGGDPVLVGAEFSLPQLLEFLSGSDPARRRLLSNPADDGPEIWECLDPCYSERDLIAALVAEVWRLRYPKGRTE